MNWSKLSILCWLLLPFVLAHAQPLPAWPMPQYESECWRGEEAYASDGWTTDVYPDTGLFAICQLGANEPPNSYPFHSGSVIGVSDTLHLVVSLHNRNQNSYSLSGLSPENWFTPILYPVGVDIWKMPALSLPATFGWRFDHWQGGFSFKVDRPSAIPSEYDVVNMASYDLVYYCWGLPAGRYQLMMAKTAQAPASFKLLKSNVVAAWTTKPASVADTISAYTACYWRAYQTRNYSSAGYWASQILAKCSSSITGLSLKARYFATINDTTGCIASIDTALAVIGRYGDPLLPDSLNMTGVTKLWYDDEKNGLEFRRYQFLTKRYHYRL